MISNEANRGRPRTSVAPVLPGDRLSTVEEFDPGSNSTSNSDYVVSTRVGEASPDMKNRVMNVLPKKSSEDVLPKVGDLIIGSVDSAQSSVAQVTIDAVNETKSEREFNGMLSFREDRSRRTSLPVKAGDLIRAKVFSTTNAIYHLTLDCPECGVMYTVCSVCGGDVIALGRERVKCKECGTVDERYLSEDFVKSSRT